MFQNHPVALEPSVRATCQSQKVALASRAARQSQSHPPEPREKGCTSVLIISRQTPAREREREREKAGARGRNCCQDHSRRSGSTRQSRPAEEGTLRPEEKACQAVASRRAQEARRRSGACASSRAQEADSTQSREAWRETSTGKTGAGQSTPDPAPPEEHLTHPGMC